MGLSALRDGAVIGLEKIGAGGARWALVTDCFHDGCSNDGVAAEATVGSCRAYLDFHLGMVYSIYATGS